MFAPVCSREDAAVGGNAHIDGDIYGRSFNIGDERYIDKNGINANNHTIRGVADGEISATSTDAINGRQLYEAADAFIGKTSSRAAELDHRMTHRIDNVGSQIAGMSSLHPANDTDKASVASACGTYRDGSSAAVGVFYRPDRKTMFSMKSAVGNSANMLSVGVSKTIGRTMAEPVMSIADMKASLVSMNNQTAQLIAAYR